MIKNYNPRPFEQSNQLPSYVAVMERHELFAQTNTGYVITLAKLTIGKSVSAGNPLTHVLFESFSDHGQRMAVARTRMNGQGSVFATVINAMIEAGVEFDSVTLCHIETLLTALGSLLQVKNPEIEKFELVSQICH